MGRNAISYFIRKRGIVYTMGFEFNRESFLPFLKWNLTTIFFTDEAEGHPCLDTPIEVPIIVGYKVAAITEINICREVL